MSGNKYILFIISVIIPIVIFTKTAYAETTATVSATVIFQNISVTVSDGSVSYGTLSANSSKSTIASDLNDTQTATNNGNLAEDLNIKGQNSSDWSLSDTSGIDQYVHQFCTSGCSNPPTGYTALTTNYQTLSSNTSSSGTQTFDLRITTPTSSSVFSQQSVDVTIQAVAH